MKKNIKFSIYGKSQFHQIKPSLRHKNKLLCFDDSESPVPLHGLHGVDIVWLPTGPLRPESVHRAALLGEGAHKPDITLCSCQEKPLQVPNIWYTRGTWGLLAGPASATSCRS